MAEISVVAEPGRPIGSRSSGRLRRAGRIPAVIYGHGLDPTPVSVDGRALRAALTTEVGLNALLSLEVGTETHLALTREIQRHPVRHTVVHVDFLIVRRDEIVSVEVPITLVGEARHVAQGDGIIEQQLTSLSVNAKPADIPGSIEVDISEMNIGDAIRVADVALPAGVTTEVDPDEAVVVAHAGALAEAVEEEAASEAEPTDGAAGAGA